MQQKDGTIAEWNAIYLDLMYVKGYYTHYGYGQRAFTLQERP